MDSPAEKALRDAQYQSQDTHATTRFLSGISIAAPLVSAVIQGDTDDISHSTSEILGATKALIDQVTSGREDSTSQRNEIIELCVHCAASAWAKDGYFEAKEWADAINSILTYVVPNESNPFNKSIFGYASVFCVLSEFGLLGDDCVNFHGICEEISSSVNKSTNKWKALNSSTPIELEHFSKSLHQASCDLFVSTLRYEYQQYKNESYRAAVDPNFKQSEFDMSIFIRRYKIYSNHLFEAIYVNATR